jgi:hypothetical protein
VSSYGRYKLATKGFCDGLAALLPLLSVSGLGHAAEHLLSVLELEASLPAEETLAKTSVPRIQCDLLTHVQESIMLRETVASYFRDHGVDDDGHACMIEMLRYCQCVLRQCRRIQRSTFAARKEKYSRNSQVRASPDKDTNGFVGRFESLLIDDDDEDFSDESVEPIQRPKDPDCTFSIQDDTMVDESNRFEAIEYLLQVEALFKSIPEEYERLKFRINQAEDDDESTSTGDMADASVVFPTMQAAVLVNMAIEEVRVLEESRRVQSQLKTFYHVLAPVCFMPVIKHLKSKIPPKVLSVNPTILLDFVAQEVEWGFIGPVDPEYYEAVERVNSFMMKAMVADVHSEAVHNCAYFVKGVIFLEVGIDVTMSKFPEMTDEYREYLGYFDRSVEAI